MGVWDKIEEEDMSGSGNGIYFKEGAYPLLKVVECKFKSATETYKKSDVFIALLEVVVESDVYKPGTIIEYVVKEKKKGGEPNTFYFKNIKKFLMACFDVTDHTEIDSKLMELVVGPKQKAKGKLVSAIGTNIKIGKARDQDFTNVDFKCAAEHAKRASTGAEA